MTPATAAALDLVLGALELVVRVLGAWRSRGHIEPADIMAAAEKMELERRTALLSSYRAPASTVDVARDATAVCLFEVGVQVWAAAAARAQSWRSQRPAGQTPPRVSSSRAQTRRATSWGCCRARSRPPAPAIPTGAS